MNFFCPQSTDAKFPLSSSGFASLLFYASSRARFVHVISFHARLSPFRLPSQLVPLKLFPFPATCVVYCTFPALEDEIDLSFTRDKGDNSYMVADRMTNRRSVPQ